MTRTLPTLSVTIITLNEEEALPKLLRKLRWADEVLVVDGGSTDRTVEIAKQFGCRVLERPFDDFASQRNFALLQARGDWVLSIDADELPCDSLSAEVCDRIERGTRAGYRIPIRSTIFGRPLRFCGTQDDRPVRLVRRRAARWHGEVHERLQVNGRVGCLHGWLEHETLADLSEFLTKMNRYTLLEVRRRLARAQPPRRSEPWLAPLLEIGRRLVWKGGMFDGPEGWAFCLLSGLSAWLTARRHHIAWQTQSITSPGVLPCSFECNPLPTRHMVPHYCAPRRDATVGSTRAAFPFGHNSTWFWSIVRCENTHEEMAHGSPPPVERSLCFSSHATHAMPPQKAQVDPVVPSPRHTLPQTTATAIFDD